MQYMIKNLREKSMFNSLRLSDAYNHHWFRKWFVTWSAPSHHLSQCCNIINSNLRSKIKWHLTWNSYIFIQDNAFENIACEMVAVLYRPQWVKLMPVNNDVVTGFWLVTSTTPKLSNLASDWLTAQTIRICVLKFLSIAMDFMMEIYTDPSRAGWLIPPSP